LYHQEEYLLDSKVIEESPRWTEIWISDNSWVFVIDRLLCAFGKPQIISAGLQEDHKDIRSMSHCSPCFRRPRHINPGIPNIEYPPMSKILKPSIRTGDYENSGESKWMVFVGSGLIPDSGLLPIFVVCPEIRSLGRNWRFILE
jgi:hypothetical protein